MDASVQEAVGVLLTPLIRSLGPSHTKLLTILRSFPSASETLALRVLSILTESGKPGPNIVALVKTLMLERDLDARFLIPIAGEMDKVGCSSNMPASLI
jgi:symplekin